MGSASKSKIRNGVITASLIILISTTNLQLVGPGSSWRRLPHDTRIEPLFSSRSAAKDEVTLKESLRFLLNSTTTRRTLAWVTQANSSGLDHDISLVTQGDVSKLPRLLDLTSRWAGPISCAMYISSENDIDVLLEFVGQGSHDSNSTYYYMDKISIHIYFETNRPKQWEYPINEMRNLAMHNVATKYIFILDIDFMPNKYAYENLVPLLPKLRRKSLWVLPAFEQFVPPGSKNDVTNVNLTPGNKSDLLVAIEKKEVGPFHAYFLSGHGPTNYAKWYRTGGGSNATAVNDIYPIKFQNYFEPYVVTHAHGVPDFYPAFRGFGYNKASWFVESHYMGYNFQVLPDHFVVHMNHVKGRRERKNGGGVAKKARTAFVEYLIDTYDKATAKTLKSWN